MPIPKNKGIFALTILALFIATALPSDGAKILLICVNVNSHVLMFSRVADDLARLGHVTELVVAATARPPDFVADNRSHVNFTYTRYPVDREVPYANSPEMSAAFTKIALSRSVIERFSIFAEFYERYNADCLSECARLLENEQVMRRIRTGGFQFAIVDASEINCLYTLPYSLGIPYASLSIPVMTYNFRVPRLPSFSASTMLAYSDRMSFAERLTAFALDMATLTMSNSSTYYAEKYAADKPPLTANQLVQRSSAWFLYEDIAVGYALPHMPNTVAIGDVMAARSSGRLADELESFVSGSVGGVIVVSFGSFFDFVPQDVTDKFCDAFRRLVASGERIRIIWKLKSVDVCSVNIEGVKIMPWIPQNDLLADSRVRLFITHGGLNSLIESVYHAKPVIVFPIAVDQPFNAVAAESRGFAIRMDLGDFSAESLVENVEKILSDRKYLLNARRSSFIMRDRRETPAERMSTLIDHVLKYGDGHLRTGAFELNLIQFFMLDIFTFILISSFVICLSVALVVYCLCRLVYRRCARNLNRERFSRSKTKSE